LIQTGPPVEPRIYSGQVPPAKKGIMARETFRLQTLAVLTKPLFATT